MGNDAAAALRNGASRVVAVEIDPTIIRLGEGLHFEKPYDSSRVEVVVDDARNYVENTSIRFDMIIFALLDSHTTSSHYTNIRIDNYVYTLEALEATRRLLKPEGVFVVKFQANTPWIAGRLRGLLTKIFGYPPVQTKVQGPYSTGGHFFVTGSKERIANALSNETFGDHVRKHGGIEVDECTLTTDDWPYFYQKEPGVPASVIIISVVLVATCIMILGRTGTRIGSMRWHFFFLGAGFLLLEVHIVSKMALLFGTTWLVNSIVIGGLLLMIVGANILVMSVSRIPVAVAYAGLFISIFVSYLIPPGQLFYNSLWLRVLVASAVLCVPVFFAGIIFVQSFARTGFSGEALGSNLIGSLVGGLLEALSFWTGIKALLLVGAFLYLCSLLTFRQEHRMSPQLKSGSGQMTYS
jgi:SAM-dependent methyltransferase